MGSENNLAWNIANAPRLSTLALPYAAVQSGWGTRLRTRARDKHATTRASSGAGGNGIRSSQCTHPLFPVIDSLYRVRYASYVCTPVSPDPLCCTGNRQIDTTERFPCCRPKHLQEPEVQTCNLEAFLLFPCSLHKHSTLHIFPNGPSRRMLHGPDPLYFSLPVSA